MLVTRIGQDDWNRNLFKSVKTGRVYVEVDGSLYTRTDEGEPCTPLCKMSLVMYLSDKQIKEV